MENKAMDAMDLLRRGPAEVELPSWSVALIESHHASSFQMEFGRWDFHKLCWVSVGQGSLSLGSEEFPLERDCFTFVESGREHRFIDDPSDPLTLVIICFGPAALVANEALDQACQQFRSSFPTPQILQGRNSFRTAEIKQLFRTMLREQSLEEIGFKSLLPVQLTELLVELTRGATLPTGRSPKGVERIDGVVAYLEKNFREPVELDAMARSAGLSRRRFSQLFKERTGLSLVDYVNRQRIAFACDRLRETGHIAYSCYESGFQDMAYFYRLFKRHTGQTPGKFIGK